MNWIKELSITNKDIILKKLEKIVGQDFVSNKPVDLFIYSQDSGASLPRPVDFVVMPKNVKEVQKVVFLANEEKIPLVPMGAGMTLSGLTIPIKGGIVVDMKRMDQILEINEISRYVIIEAGVTTGRLTAYLEKNHPELQVSIPDAPPSATIMGNALIHGSGFLSQKYGNHGDMINGLEVILPTGEICKLGSCCVSDSCTCQLCAWGSNHSRIHIPVSLRIPNAIRSKRHRCGRNPVGGPCPSCPIPVLVPIAF